MSYASEVLADSPLRYYRLNETSGTTAADATGTADGTHFNGVIPGVASATDNLAVGARYDGVDDYTQVANASDLAGWDDFTLEFWIRVLTWPSGSDLGYVFALYDTSGNNRCWGVNMRGPSSSPSDRLALLLSSNGSGFSTLNGAARSSVDDGNWHHVVFVRSGSSVVTYVDGVSGASQSFSGTLHNSGAPMAWGARSDGASPAHVELDEMAAYDHALSATRIQAHYDAAFEEPTDPTPTVMLRQNGTFVARPIRVKVNGQFVAPSDIKAKTGGSF